MSDFALLVENDSLRSQLKQHIRLRAGLREALDGWAIHAHADYGSHPERPDSITDAELCDQDKIERLRKLLGGEL